MSLKQRLQRWRHQAQARLEERRRLANLQRQWRASQRRDSLRLILLGLALLAWQSHMGEIPEEGKEPMAWLPDRLKPLRRIARKLLSIKHAIGKRCAPLLLPLRYQLLPLKPHLVKLRRKLLLLGIRLVLKSIRLLLGWVRILLRRWWTLSNFLRKRKS